MPRLDLLQPIYQEVHALVSLFAHLWLASAELLYRISVDMHHFTIWMLVTVFMGHVLHGATYQLGSNYMLAGNWQTIQTLRPQCQCLNGIYTMASLMGLCCQQNLFAEAMLLVITAKVSD